MISKPDNDDDEDEEVCMYICKLGILANVHYSQDPLWKGTEKKTEALQEISILLVQLTIWKRKWKNNVSLYRAICSIEAIMRLSTQFFSDENKSHCIEEVQ